MSISVEQCKDFKDNTCTKCGRMLPDVCKAQEDIEEKARKYDEIMGQKSLATNEENKGEIGGDVVALHTVSSADTSSEPKEASPVIKKTQVPLPKRLKK